jgi:hypothetical protein
MENENKTDPTKVELNPQKPRSVWFDKKHIITYVIVLAGLSIVGGAIYSYVKLQFDTLDCVAFSFCGTGQETIAGEDLDNNGVWDYVQDYIDRTYSDPNMRLALYQFAKADQKFILAANSDDKTLFSTVDIRHRALDCLFYIDKDPTEAFEIQNEFRAHILNTKIRSTTYFKADARLSGQSFSMPDRTKKSCDFDPDALSADTSTWKTYTNTQYGFEFKYPNNIGYIKGAVEVLNETPVIYFCFPTTDKLFPSECGSSGYASLFALSFFSHKQWDQVQANRNEGPVDAYLTENSDYVVTFATSQENPADLDTARKNIDQILSTFKFTN